MTRAVRVQAALVSLAVLAAAAAVALPRTLAADVAPLLVLVLPGAALCELLRLRVGALERTLYWVGGSVSITILSGLVLDQTVWGLTRTSISLTLAAITVVTTLTSLVFVGKRVSGWRLTFRTSPFVGALVLAACLVAAGAYLVAVHASETQRFTGFTEFGAFQARTGSDRVRVTIANREDGARRYALSLSVGRETRRLAGVSLAAGHAWSRTITIPDLCRTSRGVRMLLNLDGRGAPYRSLTLATGAARRCGQKGSP
jgi:uncharacterized membrane protein